MLFESHFDCTAAGSWEDEHGYLMTCFIRFRECHVHGRGSRNIVLMTTVDMIMGRGVIVMIRIIISHQFSKR